MPHPTLRPISFSIINIPLFYCKGRNIPDDVHKKLFLIELFSLEFLSIERIFKESTGKTQGITFNINPPIKLIIRI
jgi:hypothetical protein